MTRTKRPKLLDRWSPGPPVVVVDTETTGNIADDEKPTGNCPIQIAMIVLHGRTLVELGSWCTLIRPQRTNRNPFAMAVHRIPEPRLRDAPRNDDVVAQMERFLLGRKAGQRDPETCKLAASYYTLCGHNLAYDLRFVDLMHQRAGYPTGRFGSTGLCTQRLAKRLIKEEKLRVPGNKTNLDDLLECFNVRTRGNAAHDALEDVRRTAQLLRHLACLDGTPVPTRTT